MLSSQTSIAEIPSNPTYSVPAEEAVGIMAQIFEAVAELERFHIAHRDLKPSNVLVKARGISNAAPTLNSTRFCGLFV